MSLTKLQFTFRLHSNDYAKIKKIAKNENRSIANMIETLVKQKIRQYENKIGEIKITGED